jgi:ATP-binding cassette subfamily B protein
MDNYDNNGMENKILQVSTKASSKFVSHLLAPFWKELTALIFVVIVWSIDFSLRPYLVKVILDRLSLGSSSGAVMPIVFPIILYLAMTLGVILVMRCYDLLLWRLLPALKKQVVVTLMNRVMNHSHRYFQNNFAGDIASRIKEITRGMSELVVISIDKFFGHGLALFIAIGTIAYVNVSLGAIMFIWIILYLSISIKSARKIRDLSAAQSHARNRVVGGVVDILTNMMIVRLFAGKHHEQQNIDLWTDTVVGRERALDWFLLRLWLIQGLIFVCVLSINCTILVIGYYNNVITVGDFSLILTMYIYITECLANVAKDVGKFSEHWGLVAQGLHAIMMPDDIVDEPRAMELMVQKGEIKFDHVTFSHRQSVSLFNQLSVTIQAGQKVGLVGSSGSGKTSFVYLMLRLFDISDGAILIDGQNIAHVTQTSLRKAISIIPQDPTLFHRTIAENIRYGSFDAVEREVIVAAKKAHANDFIEVLPNKYASHVGERGAKLSGGQRQRIAIARAILKNAPIVILDEATSALDSITEQHIQETFYELMHHKTTIVIAHRLSTLMDMDRILVFDQGAIVEDGSHQQLLDKKGVYYQLWNAQVGGFLPHDEDQD